MKVAGQLDGDADMIGAWDDFRLGRIKLEPWAVHVPVEVAPELLRRLVRMHHHRRPAPGRLGFLGTGVPVPANDPGYGTQFRQPFLQGTLQGQPFFLTVRMKAVRSVDREDMDASRPGPWDDGMSAPGAVLAPEHEEGCTNQNCRASTTPSLFSDFCCIPQTVPSLLRRQTLGAMDGRRGKSVLLNQQEVTS